MSLKPDQHRAKIAKYGIGETSEASGKKPQMVVEFDVFVLPEGLTLEMFDASEYDQNMEFSFEKITWFGSFVQGEARRITMEAMMKMGFKGDFGALSEEGGGGQLDTEKYYAISVIENFYNNKTSLKVSSVYLPGESGPGARLLSKGDAAKALAGLGLEGDFKKMKADKSSGPANAARPAAAAPATAKPGGRKANF